LNAAIQPATVIVAARRTPIGAFQGALATVPAPELSAAATRACLEDTGIAPETIDQAIIGCVLQAGIGQAPARQAALAAGLPEATGTVTVNKVCGSGIQALMQASQAVRLGDAGMVLAGGMESMSGAPYLLPKARSGYRMGHQQALDHMFFDGLQNPYDGEMMGHFGEATAAQFGFTREAQDEFSATSVRRALAAIDNGAFEAEVIPVTVKHRRGETLVGQDEEPGRAKLDDIPKLRPAFSRDGTVTAASSSSISDGAASLLVTTADEAERRGLEPLARIVGFSQHAQEPAWFTTAPVQAIHKLHAALGWNPEQVDLYEINEAFACVTMAAMQECGIDHEQTNVNGGACALGHPIGATGARLMTTLIHALRQRGGKRGIAALCIGGGEALGCAIEIP
jgi:acetyl-CoA C-acetyltransferase